MVAQVLEEALGEIQGRSKYTVESWKPRAVGKQQGLGAEQMERAEMCQSMVERLEQ